MKNIIIVSIITACVLIPGIVKVPAGNGIDPGIQISLSNNSLLYAETENAGEDRDVPEESSGDMVLYRVMIVVLIIWMGLALYLFMVDRKITKLEKSLDEC